MHSLRTRRFCETLCKTCGNLLHCMLPINQIFLRLKTKHDAVSFGVLGSPFQHVLVEVLYTVHSNSISNKLTVSIVLVRFQTQLTQNKKLVKCIGHLLPALETCPKLAESKKDSNVPGASTYEYQVVR